MLSSWYVVHVADRHYLFEASIHSVASLHVQLGYETGHPTMILSDLELFGIKKLFLSLKNKYWWSL